METADKVGQERRSGTLDVIDKMLHERQEMLVLYCEVAGLEPFSHEATEDTLRRFCDVLVDYAAFCHFEIYERIVSGRERRARVIEVAEEVYPRIAEASDFAVAFSDRYDGETQPLKTDTLSHDLSLLGEELAIRVEMEDRIIAALTRR